MSKYKKEKKISSAFLYFILSLYRVFHWFGQAKFTNGESILGSSQFTQLSRLPLKTTLNLKKVKIDFKIIISLS